MKSLFAFLLAAGFATAISRAADFEGVVQMKMTGPRGAPPEMTFSLAKGHSRIDVVTPQAGPSAILFDQAKEEMTILMPAQKMYLVQPVPKPGDLPPGASQAEATVEKTTEREKILGYDCVKYLSKSGEGTTEMWVTGQLGTFMGLPSANPMGGRGRRGGMPDAWSNALRGQEAFPLRVVTRDSAGKETFRMEATAVEKKSLPESTFTPPADFQKFDMEGMMRGMGVPPGMRPPGGG